jgi:hypothetical protein
VQSRQSVLALEVRRDGRGVVLYFKRGTFAVDVVPGFLIRVSDSYPVYLVPGEDNRWIEATPERHNALFARANAECGTKLQAISRLVKAWRIAGYPPFEISSSYVDMMLATSDITSGVKSYGQSLNDFSRLSLSENSGGSLIPPAYRALSSRVRRTPHSSVCTMRQRLPPRMRKPLCVLNCAATMRKPIANGKPILGKEFRGGINMQ